jgi:hypothetical protein
VRSSWTGKNIAFNEGVCYHNAGTVSRKKINKNQEMHGLSDHPQHYREDTETA